MRLVATLHDKDGNQVGSSADLRGGNWFTRLMYVGTLYQMASEGWLKGWWVKLRRVE